MISRRIRGIVIASTVLAAALGGADVAVGQTYYVSPSGSDTALGDYENPLATILEAIGRMGSAGTIYLFDGTYTGAGNRDIVLPDYPLTIRSLSDDAEACVIHCGGSIFSPHRAFIANAGQDTTTVLRGIKIEDGWASPEGGAILLGQDSNLKAEYCIFDDNYAPQKGGAVMKAGNAGGQGVRKPVFRRCIFTNNQAAEGGAIYVFMPGGMWIDGCTFDGNTGVRGGALFTYFATDVLIERTYFQNNTATETGGAIDMSMEQYSEIRWCRFTGNEAAQGGAVANRLGYSKKGAGEKSYGDFHNCTFEGNTAEEGGAYYSYDQSAYAFRWCVFRDNFASSNGGAVKELYNADASFQDCLFVGNTAGAGGAFFRDDMGAQVLWCSTSITRCTLVGNAAFAGGAIAQTGVTLSPGFGDPHGYEIHRTIIAFNTAGAAVAVENGRPPQLTCTDIYGNTGGDWVDEIGSQWGNGNNFWGDPDFCDMAGGNYELSEDSPCLPWFIADLCEPYVGAYPQGCGTQSDVETPDAAPAAFGLLGASPNPFNPATTIAYELPDPAVVSLAIYDPAGRLVQVVEDGVPREAGRHEAVWRGRDREGRAVAAGVYLARLRADGFSATLALTLLK